MIKEKIINIIVDIMDISEQEVKGNIYDDIGMDSLDGVELVLALEEEFAIYIDDEHAEEWQTIENVIAYIEKRKKESN